MSIIFRGPTSPRVLAYIPFHELDIIISRAFQKVKQTFGSKRSYYYWIHSNTISVRKRESTSIFIRLIANKCECLLPLQPSLSLGAFGEPFLFLDHICQEQTQQLLARKKFPGNDKSEFSYSTEDVLAPTKSSFIYFWMKRREAFINSRERKTFLSPVGRSISLTERMCQHQQSFTETFLSLLFHSEPFAFLA